MIEWIRLKKYFSLLFFSFLFFSWLFLMIYFEGNRKSSLRSLPCARNARWEVRRPRPPRLPDFLATGRRGSGSKRDGLRLEVQIKSKRFQASFNNFQWFSMSLALWEAFSMALSIALACLSRLSLFFSKRQFKKEKMSPCATCASTCASSGKIVLIHRCSQWHGGARVPKKLWSFEQKTRSFAVDFH